MARPDLIGRTFVALADTLVDSYDLIEFLQTLAERCVELLDVTEAGIVLAAANGQLQVVASSSERMRMLELLEVQRSDGPCGDAFRTGEIVRSHDLESEPERWPTFGHEALAMGFRSVYAVPMRLRSDRIGALNLFADRTSGLSDVDEGLGQALADVATIGILQERALREQSALAEQLDLALRTRIVIEQAKGVLAEQGGLDVEAAYRAMSGYTRENNLKLSDVARRVVDRQLGYDAIRPRNRAQLDGG